MVSQPDNTKDAEKEPAVNEPPVLPADFYRKLLDLPSCAVNGVCDNCGRCEH
jgi:hypothetical protein